jgi:hypothetical protein
LTRWWPHRRERSADVGAAILAGGLIGWGVLRNVAPPPGAPLVIHLPRPWSVTAASAVAAIG